MIGCAITTIRWRNTDLPTVSHFCRWVVFLQPCGFHDFTQLYPDAAEKEEVVTEEVVAPQTALKESPKLTVNDFELLKTIGKGSFGKVFEVIPNESL